MCKPILCCYRHPADSVAYLSNRLGVHTCLIGVCCSNFIGLTIDMCSAYLYILLLLCVCYESFTIAP